jgi:hypothetical protein
MMNGPSRSSFRSSFLIHHFGREGKMISFKIALPALGLAFFVSVAPLWAQGLGNPANRPAVSPYINLLRGGSSGGVNYYGLVRPEIEFRSGIQRNQQQIAASQQSYSELTTGLSTTGHPTRYMTHWSYFMNNGVGTGQPSFRRPAPPILTVPQAPGGAPPARR